MAWVLVKRADETNKVILLTGQEYVVGRKGADIVLSEDLSISRMHAKLRVDHSPVNTSLPQRLPVVTIKDVSKYGVAVNGKKLESNGASSLLNTNDIIQFGIFDNVWRIIYTPLVCVTSGLSKAEKRSVSQNILRLGGHVVNEWSDVCTHLVMNKVFMTMKVVNALVSRSPILMPKYLDDVVANRAWPSQLKEYEPPKEKSVFYSDDANFQADERRQNIFAGKIFYVLSSKQEAKVKYSVIKSGGRVVCVEPSAVTEDVVRNEVSCILEPPKVMTGSASLNTLVKLLKRFGRRLVSEGEIGLSLLLCSTNKYCNPKSKEGAMVQGSLPDSQFPIEVEGSQMDETMSVDPSEITDTDSSMMAEDDVGELPPVQIKVEPVEEKCEEPTKSVYENINTMEVDNVPVKRETTHNFRLRHVDDKSMSTRNFPAQLTADQNMDTHLDHIEIRPMVHRKIFVKVLPKTGFKYVALMQGRKHSTNHK